MSTVQNLSFDGVTVLWFLRSLPKAPLVASMDDQVERNPENTICPRFNFLPSIYKKVQKHCINLELVLFLFTFVQELFTSCYCFMSQISIGHTIEIKVQRIV